MKIKLFAARPDEQAAIEAGAKAHGYEIVTTPEDFSPASVNSLDGASVLVIAQHGPLGDATIYSQLAARGVTHIALRITGYDIIDRKAAKKAGIAVTNVPAYSPRSVGEMVLAQTMGLLRHLGETRVRQAAGDYSWGGLEADEVHTLTVGIIGAGKIGSAVARLFHALGARVIANDPVQRPELSDILTYVPLDELLAQADVVTVHTPLDESSTHLINEKTLAQMKKTAFLINCARGPIVDTAALIQALESGEIAGAGLDTIEGETAIFGVDRKNNPVDHPELAKLQAMPNVIVSPHIAFYTRSAVQNMIDIALHDVELVAAGAPGAHLV